MNTARESTIRNDSGTKEPAHILEDPENGLEIRMREPRAVTR